jgi:hypothetical protein
MTIATPAGMPARTEYQPPDEPDTEPDEPPRCGRSATPDTAEDAPALLTALRITRSVAVVDTPTVQRMTTVCDRCGATIGRLAAADVRCPRG